MTNSGFSTHNQGYRISFVYPRGRVSAASRTVAVVAFLGAATLLFSACGGHHSPAVTTVVTPPSQDHHTTRSTVTSTVTETPNDTAAAPDHSSRDVIALPVNGSGISYITTPSGRFRCQIQSRSVICEGGFDNPPLAKNANEPANGAVMSADGSVTWGAGNMGDVQLTTISYGSQYKSGNWLISSAQDGITFRNTLSSAGFLVNNSGVKKV